MPRKERPAFTKSEKYQLVGAIVFLLGLASSIKSTSMQVELDREFLELAKTYSYSSDPNRHQLLLPEKVYNNRNQRDYQQLAFAVGGYVGVATGAALYLHGFRPEPRINPKAFARYPYRSSKNPTKRNR